MDALKEHIKALCMHWLANVRDAVRLNQVREEGGGRDGGYFGLCEGISSIPPVRR